MSNKSDVLSVADNVLVCQRCWDLMYPQGGESITLGFVGTRKCPICYTSISSNDIYSYAKKNDLLKYVRSLPGATIKR